MKPKIIFVTGNKHKLEEAQKALPDFQIIGQKIPLTEIQGKPEDIATAKAKEAASILNQRIIVDDTCIHLEAFNGFPGPYAADYCNIVGNERTLKMLAGFDNRNASMVCRATYCEPGQEPLIFVGKVEGTIATQICGESEFGVDPIFIPEDRGRTFAQMSTEEKNETNHRARAFKKLAEYLNKQPKSL